MPLIPKYKGKARAIAVPGQVYDRAHKWADKHGFTIGSVVATALEEFLDDRDEADKEEAAANRPRAVK